jgi:hypothetical protein
MSGTPGPTSTGSNKSGRKTAMGMYDTIVFEGDLPEGLTPSDHEFQTKSLFRIMDQFTVTKEGRLIHNTVRYVEEITQPEGIRRMVPAEKLDVDMQFHGDIVLTSYQGDDYTDYVLRFTHGTLEWIRSAGALSAEERMIAMGRNLES